MTKPDPFKYFHSSPEIIRLAVMMYVRFPLSLRNVEDLLHERGIDISHETVRYWWNRFGPMFAAEIRKNRVGRMRAYSNWRWHLDEVFVKINSETHYLGRAVDHEGEVLESFVTKRRDRKAALKFLKKSMKRHGGVVRGNRLETGRAVSYRPSMTKRSPFRYFKTSPEIIRLAVMLYVRFPLSLRNVEDLLHERGIDVSHETVRFWWLRFGPIFAAEIRKRRIQALKSSRWRWHLDEMFVKINGERHYLWRAVDHEGEVLESYVTKRRDKKAALKFLRKAMRKHGRPETIVTDRLPSYGAALKEIGAADRQETGRWLNNRAENSHLPFRRRERAMLRFRQMRSLQKFAAVHASVSNHFNQDRSLSSRPHFKLNRTAAMSEWRGLCAG